MNFRRLSVALALIALTGCAQSPVMHAPASAGVSALQSSAPVTQAAFVDALKKANVRLTDKELAVIEAERKVAPSGVMAPRPAENLSAEQNLDVHFKKHGHEFGVKSAEV